MRTPARPSRCWLHLEPRSDRQPAGDRPDPQKRCLPGRCSSQEYSEVLRFVAACHRFLLSSARHQLRLYRLCSQATLRRELHAGPPHLTLASKEGKGRSLKLYLPHAAPVFRPKRSIGFSPFWPYSRLCFLSQPSLSLRPWLCSRFHYPPGPTASLICRHHGVRPNVSTAFSRHRFISRLAQWRREAEVHQ